MKLFKRKNKRFADKVEARFQQALVLVKDLDKREYNRFVDGLTLAWQGYDRIRRVQTIDEKENSDLEEVEKFLEKEKNER